jgi:thiol-disulfide isomerase/thioredoxin
MNLSAVSACRLRVAAALLAMTASAASAQPASTAPSPTRTPVVRTPGNADWAATLSEARTRAAADKKLVFVEFARPGCGNCERMDTLLYPAFEFEGLLVGMVPVKVDIESPEGQAMAGRYDVTDTPSILVTNPAGRLVFLMQGFQNAEDFYVHIHKDLDTYRPWARQVDAQQIERLSAAEALESGRTLFERRDSAAALPRFQRAATAPGAKPAERDAARELEAAALLDLGRTAESRKAIEGLIASTRDPDCRERAEIFRAQLPLSEGNPAEALRLFQAFQKAHPQSKYAAGVDDLIRKLEASKAR